MLRYVQDNRKQKSHDNNKILFQIESNENEKSAVTFNVVGNI